jgi:hypothetical protein
MGGTTQARAARESSVQAHAGGVLVQCTRAGLPVRELHDLDLVKRVLKAGDHLSISAAKENIRRSASARPARGVPLAAAVATAALDDEAAVRQRREALWVGHKRLELPEDLTACSKAQLIRMVQQAGAQVDRSLPTEALAREAEALAPAWEVERVLACGSHLEVLRLGQNAGAETIKASFRRLSRAVHPDKNDTPRALAAMQRVSTAYAGLMASQGGSVAAVR